jgi:hypothetical protein
MRACALKHGGSWDKSLSYAEFSYNNSYQASLKMTPFEALYGRKYRTRCTRVRQVNVGGSEKLEGIPNTRVRSKCTKVTKGRQRISKRLYSPQKL